MIPDHEVYSVIEIGWSSRKNGELLSLAAQNGYDAFITIDKKLEYQQNIAKHGIPVIVLMSFRNTAPILQKKIPELLELLKIVSEVKVYHC